MDYVSKKEIENRVEKFQRILKDEGLDGAFVMQNSDIFYFAGTIQISFLFVPRQGEPILMVRKSFERAKRESPLKRVLRVRGRNEILPLLRDHGHRSFLALGLELDVLPAEHYLWFGETFPGTRWRDVSHQIRRLRMIKSDYEVAQIRKATTILDKGFNEIRGVIREGMTELEIDGHLAYIARREGHMGILRMRGWNQEMTYAHVLSGESGGVLSYGDTPAGGSGNTPAMAQGAGFRRIRRNEPICIDYGVGVNGYLSDQTRTFVIGELAEPLKRAHDCSRDIHRMLVQEAGPGVTCAHLYELAQKQARNAGLGDFFMGHGEGKVKFIGHGIGLEIDDYPIVTPGFPEPLREGMVIAVEPKFVFPAKGIVGLEDDYLVTSSGLERLTLTAQEVIRVD